MAAADGTKMTQASQLAGQNVLALKVGEPSANALSDVLSAVDRCFALDEFSASGSFTPQLQARFQHQPR